MNTTLQVCLGISAILIGLAALITGSGYVIWLLKDDATEEPEPDDGDDYLAKERREYRE